MDFNFGPLTFNFVYGPDFCYISFDLVRLDPSIAINSILMFHFGPPFNFRIGLKKLNIFGTEFQFLQLCPLIENINKYDFHFSPYTFIF